MFYFFPEGKERITGTKLSINLFYDYAPNGELCSISEIVFICKVKWVTHSKWSSEEQLYWFGLTRPRVNLKLFHKPSECSHIFLKHSELLYATICYIVNRADKSHYPVPSPGNHEIWVLLTWSIYIWYLFKDKTFLKLPFTLLIWRKWINTL